MKNERCMVAVAIIAASSIIGAGIFSLISGSIACGETKGSSVNQHTTQSKASIPTIPSFAVRSKIPPAGKQGPPAEAATLIGHWQKGESLFEKNCQSCHGPQGTDNVSNPGSDDGAVPPLHPIDPKLVNKNPSIFAANIDRIIQYGSMPDGSNPTLFMPNWGDSKILSQQDIADLEAYIMHLNEVAKKKTQGVRRDPGNSPPGIRGSDKENLR
jgi:mono/diheme cytochrome c family protein